MVVLADLHNKSYGKENYKLIRDIKNINPDIIVVAGDIINANPGYDNTNAYEFIGRLAKDYPIYYGMGNHEYRTRIYPENYGSMYADMKQIYADFGIDLLENKRVFLDEYNIDIVGLEIDRYYYKRFKTMPMDNSYVESLVGKHKEDCFEILIAHNPDYFKNYEFYGSDLILAGHVHGGLIRLPILGGVAHPGVKFFPKYNKGEYGKGKSKMLVSTGLGTHTLPLRLFDPAELTVVELNSIS